MEKAGIITVISSAKKAVDKAKEDDKDIEVTSFAGALFKATQDALEKGKGL